MTRGSSYPRRCALCSVHCVVWKKGRPLNASLLAQVGGSGAARRKVLAPGGTARGLAQSAGLMVNYRYVLDHCAPNNEAYALHGAIDSSAMETALAAEEGVALPEEW